MYIWYVTYHSEIHFRAKAYTSFYTDCEPITFFDQRDRHLQADDPNKFKETKSKAFSIFYIGLTLFDILKQTIIEDNSEKVKSENFKTCGELHTKYSDSPPTCICKATLEVTADVDKNVFLYYKLDNFYQNHRRMMQSRDEIQLLAKTENDIKNPR